MGSKKENVTIVGAKANFNKFEKNNVVNERLVGKVKKLEALNESVIEENKKITAEGKKVVEENKTLKATISNLENDILALKNN